MGVVSYVFLDIVRFSLAWPPTTSSVGILVKVARSSSCRVPCCEYFFGYTVLHEVSRFSAPEAVIIISITRVGVRFLLLFLKELLYCGGKDFQLSYHFCFSVVTGF